MIGKGQDILIYLLRMAVCYDAPMVDCANGSLQFFPTIECLIRVYLEGVRLLQQRVPSAALIALRAAFQTTNG